MNDARMTELEALTAAIAAYDADTANDWKARVNEPAEMTAKRNRASELIFELDINR